MGVYSNSENGPGFLRERVLSVPMVVAAATVDARSTGETYKLQPGLVLGVITSGGKLTQYDDGASDGSQTAKYILMQAVDMRGNDPDASVADQVVDVLEIGAVRKDGLGGYDAAAKVDLAGKIEIIDD